ncbi:unnamed protein product [Symbiodinium natans]|uniref:Uncharacterized protein n=1 Tax=Symbiodinium natans TaxID=878477 RepID=A0A812PXD6_9DINO|nr:unnamed protein product [Symbiodinium natans]
MEEMSALHYHAISFNGCQRRLMDDFGRVWQQAGWDDDLRSMNPDDLVCSARTYSPRRVYFRVDAANAPCILPFQADLFRASPPHERSIAACHLDICAFLRAILGRDVLQDALLAICFFLPVRERRAFSCLATSFRSATTRAWSNDPSANEQTLLAIVRKDQPELLSRAITDSGMCKASLGRVLLQATARGRLHRRHRCCRLLGEMGAVIRPEDAVMVSGGYPCCDVLYVRQEKKRNQICYVGLDFFMQLESPSADLVDSMVLFQARVRDAAKARKEPFWCHVEDGGYSLCHVAFSSGAVPPQDGWHAGEGGNIHTRPVVLGDLLYSGMKSSGPILGESDVQKALGKLFNLETRGFRHPPQWIPTAGRIPACDHIF